MYSETMIQVPQIEQRATFELQNDLCAQIKCDLVALITLICSRSRF